MYRHGPSCQLGPVSRLSDWWASPSLGPDATKPDNDSAPRPEEEATLRQAGVPPSPKEPVRKEFVERIRREIAAGTYETSEKWEAALERLFQRLDRECTPEPRES
jgi:hypothetical protein